MLKRRIISGVAMVFFVLILLLLDQFWLSLVLAAATLWAMGELWSVNQNKHQTATKFWLYLVLPAIYIIFSLNLAVKELRWNGEGWWLILALFGTSAYDTMAFFVGRGLGKRKIVPKISPNKTWEGTIGGFSGSILVVALIGKYFLLFNWLQIIIIGIMIGILAFFGDLLISWYKRRLKVKDMGRLIPGHGGLLDRIDSHLLVFLGLFLFRISV